MARTQLHLELGSHLVYQLPGGQLLILPLALVEPLPQRGMGFLRVTIPPVDQGLPSAATGLVCHLQLGQTLGVHRQV